MRFFKKYRKKYWKLFSFAVVFLMLEAMCDLMLPTIMAKIVDVGVAGNQMDYVVRMGGLMLLITTVGAVSASGRNILSSRVSQQFGAELRADLFSKIQFLSFENLDKFDKASLVTRLTNDVIQVQNFVNGLMRVFMKAPLLCIGSLIMAIRLNPNLAVILAVIVPIVCLLIILNMKVGYPLFLNMQKAMDRVNSIMREYLSGVRVVKAFNQFDYEVEKFGKANKEYQERSMNAMRAMAVFGPTITLTVNFGIIAVIWLGGIRVNNGQMQVGHIIAFTNYMTQILFSLMTISMVFNMFVRARASTGRIGEVLALENAMKWPEGHGKNTQIAGKVEFKDVHFSYVGQSDGAVIKDITLTINPGETIGIIGSTGSGKSTLISLIPRFYDAVSGTVKVNGEDVKQFNPSNLREKIAIVPQKTVLFSGTVRDNIGWGKEDATMEQIEQAAKMADAHEFISSFPDGYQTKLGQDGVNVSGGQKQRICIARALIRQPDILILDDCTSAVDVVTEANIKGAIKKYAKNLTCILIAQRITSVMDADRIVVMDQGYIVATGQHDVLMETCTVYQEIFQSQMGRELQKNV
ncbi:ABC transporter ATP-binding protein [Paenibacillus sp. V4I7]|uniref:ABC transporter ATP-binding protein n=1 Tax=Paenibacillus sp. V4I7 TaxID=3042307 RepID=UPI002788F75F|nr:ABC transporter ATP-binding protein [Paenibacillus sp. V4I7]MDQ0899297.1 ATP-binding cassette subfamily B multidrug efflux pump [Paenibacillus sp. V4I7]